MRYVVLFSDRTSRRVNEQQAQAFRNAMKSRGTVDFRGSTYAGYSIVAVKTLSGFYQDKREEIEARGAYFCVYGREHQNRLDCGCKDAKLERLITQEELLMIAAPDDELPKLISSPMQND